MAYELITSLGVGECACGRRECDHPKVLDGFGLIAVSPMEERRLGRYRTGSPRYELRVAKLEV